MYLTSLHFYSQVLQRKTVREISMVFGSGKIDADDVYMEIDDEYGPEKSDPHKLSNLEQ